MLVTVVYNRPNGTHWRAFEVNGSCLDPEQQGKKLIQSRYASIQWQAEVYKNETDAGNNRRRTNTSRKTL